VPAGFCAYCLRPISGRSTTCSEWCKRRVRGKTGYVTRSRREAVAKVLARAQRRVRFVPQWRQIAMGEDPSELLPAIFGTAPCASTPRHGDTLDA
jgi:hypothetical protein